MRSDARCAAPIADRLPVPGIGTRQQWLDAGAVHRMFEDGRLVRIARGLYVAAGDVDIAIDRLAALLPEGAVIGGWAAAELFGFRDAGPMMASTAPQPVLAYLARDDHRRPTGFAVRRSDLLGGESIVQDGVLVTSPARTAYDLGRFSTSVRAAVGFLDAALWQAARSPVSRVELADMAAAHPHGKGNPLFRAAIDLANGRARSFAESSLRVRWVRELDVSRHAVLTNAVLDTSDGPYELDLVDLTAGLVIEYDGKHHAGSDQRSRDARKDAAIRECGLAVTRCNAPELRASMPVFARWAQQRRTAARANGSHVQAAALLHQRRLAEGPLKLY